MLCYPFSPIPTDAEFLAEACTDFKKSIIIRLYSTFSRNEIIDSKSKSRDF
jgi:hypothetical protein